MVWDRRVQNIPVTVDRRKGPRRSAEVDELRSSVAEADAMIYEKIHAERREEKIRENKKFLFKEIEEKTKLNGVYLTIIILLILIIIISFAVDAY